MQEFTVSTPDEVGSEGGQGEVESTPSARLTQKKLGKKPEIEGNRKIRNCFNVVITLLSIGLVAIAIVWGYLRFKSSNEGSDDSEVQGLRMERESPEEGMISRQAPPSVKDKTFFTDMYNIYVSDKDGSNKVRLTEYQDGTFLKDLKLINETTLGFYRCEGSLGDFGCKILTVNITTKEVTTVREVDPNALLVQTDWINEDGYVYSAQYHNQSRLVGIYVKNELETQIFEHEFRRGDRDDFIEDDSQIRFSPKGDKIYQIYTKGGQGFDFTVYVFDLRGNGLDEIENATYPAWVDNDTVVYRRYSNKTSGYLYLRDLKSNKSARVERSSMAAYGPEVSGGRMFYWEASGLGSTYVYDFARGEGSLLYENSAYPKVLSDEEILIALTRSCRDEECEDYGTREYETQFVVDMFVVLNLTSGEKSRIESSVEELKGGVVTWYQRNI